MVEQHAKTWTMTLLFLIGMGTSAQSAWGLADVHAEIRGVQEQRSLQYSRSLEPLEMAALRVEPTTVVAVPEPVVAFLLSSGIFLLIVMFLSRP